MHYNDIESLLSKDIDANDNKVWLFPSSFSNMNFKFYVSNLEFYLS